MLKKITANNGFDTNNPANARQNNYAWSMAEFYGYVYVGTGRNIAALGLTVYNLSPLDKITPPVMDNLAEIWRYPVGSDNTENWELVYKAEPSTKIYGFREMIVYTDKNGVKALCAGCTSIDKSTSYIMYSTDGFNWTRMNSDMPQGYNSRSFFEFNGILYCGTNNTLGGEQTVLLAADSFSDGFKVIHLPQGENNPNGNIMSLAELNGYLYIGTATGEGFGIWKSSSPESGNWILVVDRGAGDKLNEWAMTMQAFKGYLYVGTAVTGGTVSVDLDKKFVPFKGFDLIRIDSSDNWEVIVGGEPVNPIETSTGERNTGIYPSGFGNAFNCYCWQMNVYNNKLYLSTWDAALLYKDVLINEIKTRISVDFDFDNIEDLSEDFLTSLMSQNILDGENYNWILWAKAVLSSLPRYPAQHGFDLYSSSDGLHFKTLSLNGFKNPKNYGLRTMLAASDDKLYLGTANVYQGCEVWTLENGQENYRKCCCRCCKCCCRCCKCCCRCCKCCCNYSDC